MALGILAIPTMSSEVEHVFSSCSTGLMVTGRRSRLEDIIEAAECMKSWRTDGGIMVRYI